MTLDEITNLIDQYRKKSEASLSQVAGAPATTDFAEQLRTRLTSGKDISELISNIAQQRSRLLSIPAETRAEAPIGVYSPTQVAGLISQREEPVRSTWETLMGVKQAREGKMEDIITRATQGYEAQIQKQQTKYDQERQKLQDLVAERNWIGQQAQQATQQTQYTAEQAEEKRRWEAQQTLEERRVAVAERPETLTPTQARTDLQRNLDNFATRLNAGEPLSSVPVQYQPYLMQIQDLYSPTGKKWEALKATEEDYGIINQAISLPAVPNTEQQFKEDKMAGMPYEDALRLYEGTLGKDFIDRYYSVTKPKTITPQPSAGVSPLTITEKGGKLMPM